MILDKLLGTLLLTLSVGSNIDLTEPNRALMPETYEIINATSNVLHVDSGYYDETYTIQPNTTEYVSFKTEDDVYVWTNTNPSGIGYCYLAADSEDLNPITWIQETNYWYASIEAYSSAYGIGFYRQRGVDTTKDYYLNTNAFDTTIPTQDQEIQLFPDDVTLRIYKEDGSFTQVNGEDLILFRQKVDGSPNMAVALGMRYATNDYELFIIVAMNFLYAEINAFDPARLKEMAESRINTLSPSMFFYGGFTNKIRFVSGYYPFVPNEKGYVDFKYATQYNMGYLGFNSNMVGENSDTFTALGTGIDLMTKALEVAAGFFSFVVFPGITIGVLLLLPLLAALLLWLIKLLKRGG